MWDKQFSDIVSNDGYPRPIKGSMDVDESDLPYTPSFGPGRGSQRLPRSGSGLRWSLGQRSNIEMAGEDLSSGIEMARPSELLDMSEDREGARASLISLIG